MKKVLYFEPPEVPEEEKQYLPPPPRYAVDFTAGLTITIQGNVGEGRTMVDKTIAIDPKEHYGKVLEIYFYDGASFTETAVREIYSTPVPFSGLRGPKTANETTVALCAIGEDGGEITVLLNKATDNPTVTGGAAVKVIRDKPAIGLLKEHSESFAAFYAGKFSLKHGFIKGIDVYQNLAYLETQVDVLTRALMELLPPGHPLYGCLREADKNSSLDGVTAESALDKLYGDKGKFRERLKKYRQEKEKAGIPATAPMLPPQPSSEEVTALARASFDFFVKKRLDGWANGRGYDSIDSLVLYANENEPNEKYRREGIQGVVLKSRTWQKCYEIMGEVLSGQRTIPTEEELVAELPALDWGDGE